MDAPGSHLTYVGRCKRAWVSPAAWCTYRAGSVAKNLDRPFRKFAFPMAREGGWVGQGGSTHVGTGLPVYPWTLGTLQGHLSVCGVLYGLASHPRPLPGARFWPVFRAKFATSERGFLVCGDGTGRIDA